MASTRVSFYKHEGTNQGQRKEKKIERGEREKEKTRTHDNVGYVKFECCCDDDGSDGSVVGLSYGGEEVVDYLVVELRGDESESVLEREANGTNEKIERLTAPAKKVIQGSPCPSRRRKKR